MRWTLAIAAVLLSASVRAQELEPRAFSPGPRGLNIVAVNGSYSSGDLVFDSSLPLKDVTSKVTTVGAGYQRFFGLWGKTAKFAVAGAWATGDAHGFVQDQFHARHFVGFTDPRVAFSYIFLGAPSMTAAEYAKYKPKTLAGFAASLSPPVGAYENNRLLNVSTNRWTFRPQLGISRYQGPWTFEGTLGAQFFSTNDEYYPGHARQEQAPIESLQVHCAYTIRPQMWVAASATYYRGGAPTIDGVEGAGFQSNSRYGVTGSMALPHRQSVTVNYSRGLSVRAGSNYDTLIVAWAARFMDRR
jgi:outer membrane putative beta-barrel porin/alpha-amylase